MKAVGRLGKLNHDVQPPAVIILPSKSRIVLAYVRFIHCRDGHFGGSYLRSVLSEEFHIFGLSSMVRSIVRRCVACCKAQGRPLCPRMADLPTARIEAVGRPFVHCGLDVFGPFYVQERRSVLKRYGVVFSCLTSRAVHFEVIFSLTTDSFINSFRRFQARRGNSFEIYCDNGTNFVGACRELEAGMREVNKVAVLDRMAEEGIRWHFRPPHASHWGGVWEREIRTARKVFVVPSQRKAL